MSREHMVQTRTVKVILETLTELKQRITELEEQLAKVSLDGETPETIKIGKAVRVVKGKHFGCVGVVEHVMPIMIDLRLDSRTLIRKKKENVVVVD